MLKFEEPRRLAELDIEQTLKNIGLREGITFCDFGAGSGIFSIPAARYKDTTVYAIDISEDMMAILKKRKDEYNLQNLDLSYNLDNIEDGSVDVMLLSTVLHHVHTDEKTLKDIARVIKPGATLAIIEFHYRETSYGPPLNHRISEEFIEELSKSLGFLRTNKWNLGENLYCLTFDKTNK